MLRTLVLVGDELSLCLNKSEPQATHGGAAYTGRDQVR